MTADLEVYFCDLCNESVPASDLDAARAVRVEDRVVGACCVAKLNPTAPPRPASSPQAAGTTGRGGGVFLGVLLLVGIAAAATFLDWRIADEAKLAKAGVTRLTELLGETSRRLAAVEDALAKTAGRAEIAMLTPKFASLETGIEGFGRSLQKHAGLIDGLGDVLTEVQRSARTREAELLAALNELRSSVDATNRDLAAMRAAPRPAPGAVGDASSSVPERPVAVARPTADALPPELEHSVLALTDEDPGTRFAAVDKLVRSRDLRVVGPLAAAAKDNNAFVRRLTVDGLREFKHVDAVDALLVALADQESVVRHTAHASLCALTRQRFEFDPDANPSSRASSQRRWQDWWNNNRASFAF